MAGKMKKKIQVSVGSVAQALDRFEHAWRQAEKSGVRATQVRLTFDSLPTLLKNLTPARWTLLEQLKRDGPLSINELARRLARHYKNVHTDVTRLIELDLIERRNDHRVVVVWDIVSAEMRLAARVPSSNGEAHDARPVVAPDPARA
jgi:predicted transcriptional regulator